MDKQAGAISKSGAANPQTGTIGKTKYAPVDDDDASVSSMASKASTVFSDTTGYQGHTSQEQEDDVPASDLDVYSPELLIVDDKDDVFSTYRLFRTFEVSYRVND